MNFIIKVIISAVSIYLVGVITKLFVVKDFSTAFITAFVLAIVNILIRPLLIVLTLPITILTLGIFLFFINGLMLIIVSKIVPTFVVNSWFNAALASLLISICNSCIEKIVK